MSIGFRPASRRRRLLIAVVVACAACALVPGPAVAKTKPKATKTTVEISTTGAEKFTGTVTSPKKACEKGRTVNLYRQQEGARINLGTVQGFDLEGSSFTGPTGFWEIDASRAFLEGNYQASVTAKTVGFEGHRYRCMAATSPLTHA